MFLLTNTYNPRIINFQNISKMLLLKNHVASRFLDEKDDLVMEILEHTHPNAFETAIKGAEKAKTKIEGVIMEQDIPAVLSDTYALLVNKDSKNYVVTNSVLDLLEMLKIEKYDWGVFKKIKEGRYTFILPGNKLIRMYVQDSVIWFFHLEQGKTATNVAPLNWVMFYFNRQTGEPCSHYSSVDVQTLEPFVYRLLCFMFLTENDELELKPGQKSGTKKSGKVINTLKQNVTIVNSRWNTTIIVRGEFGVRGHFRLQPYGPGRSEVKPIFIEPFIKTGITRVAKSQSVK